MTQSEFESLKEGDTIHCIQLKKNPNTGECFIRVNDGFRVVVKGYSDGMIWVRGNNQPDTASGINVNKRFFWESSECTHAPGWRLDDAIVEFADACVARMKADARRRLEEAQAAFDAVQSLVGGGDLLEA